MKILCKAKDGGPESPVDGYFLIEIKSLFSVALLKFNKGGRENFHTHAFQAWTWFILGNLEEEDISGMLYKYKKSLLPKRTTREKNHRVKAYTNSWCFTIRGPWDKEWTEYNRKTNRTTVLVNGRNVVDDYEGF